MEEDAVVVEGVKKVLSVFKTVGTSTLRRDVGAVIRECCFNALDVWLSQQELEEGGEAVEALRVVRGELKSVSEHVVEIEEVSRELEANTKGAGVENDVLQAKIRRRIADGNGEVRRLLTEVVRLKQQLWQYQHVTGYTGADDPFRTFSVEVMSKPVMDGGGDDDFEVFELGKVQEKLAEVMMKVVKKDAGTEEEFWDAKVKLEVLIRDYEELRLRLGTRMEEQRVRLLNTEKQGRELEKMVQAVTERHVQVSEAWHKEEEEKKKAEEEAENWKKKVLVLEDQLKAKELIVRSTRVELETAKQMIREIEERDGVGALFMTSLLKALQHPISGSLGGGDGGDENGSVGVDSRVVGVRVGVDSRPGGGTLVRPSISSASLIRAPSFAGFAVRPSAKSVRRMLEALLAATAGIAAVSAGWQVRQRIQAVHALVTPLSPLRRGGGFRSVLDRVRGVMSPPTYRRGGGVGQTPNSPPRGLRLAGWSEEPPIMTRSDWASLILPETEDASCQTMLTFPPNQLTATTRMPRNTSGTLRGKVDPEDIPVRHIPSCHSIRSSTSPRRRSSQRIPVLGRGQSPHNNRPRSGDTPKKRAPSPTHIQIAHAIRPQSAPHTTVEKSTQQRTCTKNNHIKKSTNLVKSTQHSPRRRCPKGHSHVASSSPPAISPPTRKPRRRKKTPIKLHQAQISHNTNPPLDSPPPPMDEISSGDESPITTVVLEPAPIIPRSRQKRAALSAHPLLHRPERGEPPAPPPTAVVVAAVPESPSPSFSGGGSVIPIPSAATTPCDPVHVNLLANRTGSAYPEAAVEYVAINTAATLHRRTHREVDTLLALLESQQDPSPEDVLEL